LINRKEDGSAQLPDVVLLRAYNDLVSRSPEYEQRYLTLLSQLSRTETGNPYVQAALAHQALAEGKSEEALAHLTVGIKLGAGPVYEDKGRALANLDRGDEAIAAFLQGIEVDPYRPELRKNLILEYTKLKRYTEARRAMEEYVQLFPEDALMRSLLARVSK
jgi:Flp pilus assembly protein TadD